MRDGDEFESLLTLQVAVERMEHSVEQVLMLYRTAPDQFAANFTEVDLTGLARTIIAELYPQLEAKGQQIELLGDRQLLSGDEFALRTLLVNLIGNASKYSGASGEIRVVIEAVEDSVVLRVEDSGPGIPADQRDKVFERFYRIGSGRHDTAVPGTGIGLAVVQHVAEIHSASIELTDSDFASGLAVIVTFPCSIAVGSGV